MNDKSNRVNQRQINSNQSTPNQVKQWKFNQRQTKLSQSTPNQIEHIKTSNISNTAVIQSHQPQYIDHSIMSSAPDYPSDWKTAVILQRIVSHYYIKHVQVNDDGEVVSRMHWREVSSSLFSQFNIR